jgi:protein-tyrosine phosphatase
LGVRVLARYNPIYVNAVPTQPLLHLDWLVALGGPLFDTPGQVALSSCPGRPDLGGTVRGDIERLVTQGIGVVVSLVDDREMEFYGAYGLRAALREAGVRSIHFPLIDTQPPDDLFATRTLCREILGWLGEGQHTLVHCIGGWGRSGTIAASLLTHQGYAAPQAIALVRQARNPRCVESRAQERFVYAYADAQAEYERYHFIAEPSKLPELLTGQPGARLLRRRLVPPQALLTVGELRDQPEYVLANDRVVLSGERLRFSGGPEAVTAGDYPVDRAFVLRGGEFCPEPLARLAK